MPNLVRVKLQLVEWQQLAFPNFSLFPSITSSPSALLRKPAFFIYFLRSSTSYGASILNTLPPLF